MLLLVVFLRISLAHLRNHLRIGWTLNLRAEPLRMSLIEKWWQEPELNRRFNSAPFKVINTLILLIFVS